MIKSLSVFTMLGLALIVAGGIVAAMPFFGLSSFLYPDWATMSYGQVIVYGVQDYDNSFGGGVSAFYWSINDTLVGYSTVSGGQWLDNYYLYSCEGDTIQIAQTLPRGTYMIQALVVWMNGYQEATNVVKLKIVPAPLPSETPVATWGPNPTGNPTPSPVPTETPPETTPTPTATPPISEPTPTPTPTHGTLPTVTPKNKASLKLVTPKNNTSWSVAILGIIMMGCGVAITAVSKRK